jgi:hypothetical protein
VVIFLDRQVELALLRRELKRRGFGLLVIYGRRRVGKTALVLKATEDMRRLYYLAVERGNLPRLKRAAAALDPQARYVEEDWEALFAFLAQRVDVVVIDEFPNLIAEDKAVLSTLQAVVDQVLSGTNMKLVLVGSSVSVMTSRVLSYKSPLYGRKTLAMHVKPVPFLEYRRFFPERPAEELVEIHGFAGGIPHYMLKIGKPFWQFLDAELREKTFILDEGDFLLRYEFEDVSTYKLILEAVAAGRGTLGEIRDYARLKATDITPYLRNLAQAGLIEKTRPVLGRGRYRYRIADRFLNFWFRFINPNRSAIEEGLYTADDVKREYPQYLGPVFEDVAREVVIEEMKAGRLPRAARLGPQWWTGKSGPQEIDLLALGRGVAVAVEVKWSDGVDPEEVAESLAAKVAQLGLETKTIYVVVAKSFAKKVDKLRGDPLKTYDLTYIDQLMKTKAQTAA